VIRTRIKEETTRPHERPRPGRATWCGELRLGSLLVPVKAYGTVQSSSGTQLCQVHVGCGCRIEQPRTCPKHGPLKPDQIGKAFAYSPSQLVELSPADLQSLTPPDEKIIVLEQFFDCESLDLVLLAGRSLQLAPSHPAAEPLYAAAVCGLTKTHKWALGHVVFSGRRQLIVVRPESHRLILHTLHDPRQLHGPIPLTSSANTVPQKIVKVICAAINHNAGPVAWDDLGDDAAQRLAALVNDRVNGVKQTNGRTKPKGSRSPRNGQVRKAARAA
jgi:DNA end-binding protein Ku